MILAILITGTVSFLAGAAMMSISAVSAYDKGYKDGREGL